MGVVEKSSYSNYYYNMVRKMRVVLLDAVRAAVISVDLLRRESLLLIIMIVAAGVMNALRIVLILLPFYESYDSNILLILLLRIARLIMLSSDCVFWLLCSSSSYV